MAATEGLQANHLSRQGLRVWAIAGALVLALLIAILWRAASEPIPAISIHRTVADVARIPGAGPTLAWPQEGQAAVEVEGLGTLGTSGSQAPAPIASVAKVMTAYLTLLSHPLAIGREGFVMTVTPAGAAEAQQRAALGQSTVPVRAGERISERQALQALLLPSANNIAVMLADYQSGSVDAFVDRMNATARRLGMGSTTYTDPSGYQRGTVSTASDQLLLARAAMGNRVFAAIVAERSADIPVAGEVTNYNALVGEDGYVGVKTGSDRAAGGCLIFAKRVLVGGRRLTVLGVVLGQREGSVIQAALFSARRLGDSVAATLAVHALLGQGTSVATLTSADGRRVAALTTAPLRVIGWPGLAVGLHVALAPLASTVRAGQPLARVSVSGSGGRGVRAVAPSGLGSPSLGWRLRHLL